MPLILNGSTGISASGGSAVIADGQIGAAQLASQAVTAPKLASGVPGRSNLPTGAVLQVVSTTFSSTQAFVGTSGWQDISTLSVSITPTSATSKILLLGSVAVDGSNNTYLRFMRNSTAIGIGDTAGGNYRVTMGNGFVGSWSGNANQFVMFSNFHLDSPATTSAITYKIQVVADSGSGSGTCYINYSADETGPAGRPISTITAMEIAA